jgi:segregation and condensation protein A
MAEPGGDGPGPNEPEVPGPDQTVPDTKPDTKPGIVPGTVQPGPEVTPEPGSPAAVPEGGSVPTGQIQDIVEDPVEILVGLAERGEIDPWNINIIEVTDRFLSELERCRQLNLQVSGRTLFYASTLLRMKSELLEVVEAAEDEDDGGDPFGDEFGGGAADEIDYGNRLGPIERLEHEIQRRLDRKNLRKSPITLFELITELKNIEKEERRRRRMAADPSESMLVDADDVVSIAHEEGFQESSLTRLEEYLEGLEIDEEMTLAALCEKMEWGIPEVYIPLLFLALDGRCALRQEEFYGDIWVQICRADGE